MSCGIILLHCANALWTLRGAAVAVIMRAAVVWGLGVAFVGVSWGIGAEGGGVRRGNREFRGCADGGGADQGCLGGGL